MHEETQGLLPDNLSDESAYHLVNFINQLAFLFESTYFGQIMRYEKSKTDLRDPLFSQDSEQETDLQDPPF